MSHVMTTLAALSLFEVAVIRGVRVVRRSLLGFQIEGRDELFDAVELAARLEARRRERRPAVTRGKPLSARIALCTRCAGDGLGRRNRGVCGLCHGPGIQAALPPGGFAALDEEELAAVVDQALAALRSAAYPRARRSLLSLLDDALPLAPAPVQARARGELRAA